MDRCHETYIHASAPQLVEKLTICKLVRRCGFGVPDLERRFVERRKLVDDGCAGIPTSIQT